MNSFMLENLSNYRYCVAMLIKNKENKIFLGKRINSNNSWHIPQGGIEINEDPKIAMFRELKEETGIQNDIDIIACYPNEIFYEIPQDSRPKSWNNKYIGQRVTVFFLKFHGKDSDINLNNSNQAEFSEFKWIDYRDFSKIDIVDFKKNMYIKISDYLNDLILYEKCIQSI